MGARGGWRDFNGGDSFDGRGDERIDPELDRWYYKFDLQRHVAAYQGRQIDYNLVVKAGPSFTTMFDPAGDPTFIVVRAGRQPVANILIEPSRRREPHSLCYRLHLFVKSHNFG